MSRFTTIHTLLLCAKEKLDKVGIDGGWRDARLLLASVLDVRPDYLIAHSEAGVPLHKIEHFYQYLERRLKREPVSRILGTREFWSLPFKISPATLDPRPDSETLIEAVLKDYPDHCVPLKILDLGTGSGCLLLTLLKEYPEAYGLGIDISLDALLTARENAVNLQVCDRVNFVQSSWGKGLKGSFDVLVSNPPYIPVFEINNLDPEVKLYEPLNALDGGERGLDCYHILALQFSLFSHRGTRLYLEIGQGQENAVEKIMKEAGYVCAIWHRDLAGIKRCGVFSFSGDVS
jgi:release factor glutamine methyltransferase